MKMLCALGGHEAGEQETYNSGYYFSQCRRCNADMVRSGGSWQAVPGGHKVVWKAGRHAHSMAPERSEALARVQDKGSSGAIDVAAAVKGHPQASVPLPQARRTNGAASAPSAQKNQFPYLLATAALVGVVLQFTLGLKDLRGGF